MNNKIPDYYLKRFGWQTLPSFLVLLFVALTKGYTNFLGYWLTLLAGWLLYSLVWVHFYWKYIGDAEAVNKRAFYYSIATFQLLFIGTCLIYVYYL
ncbi:hypothetical protein [Shewanella sp.]|uniref:hypothetical protein n=1 Tax=Shewanella sp. TaxID=50422 RepID=UPI00258C3F59|nr:hypothetical protein [Shewanella sp.]MCJ8305129.1 hypothetical protein [Shewanella sp.]NQY27666.1 hypothetical protein [Piscirickettsiaceae bacterium]